MHRWFSPPVLVLGLSIFSMAWGGSSVAAAGDAGRLELSLPDRSATIPLVSQAGSLHLTLESLAHAVQATVQEGPGGRAALVWEGGRIVFTPGQRKVVTSAGTAALSVPARRRGDVVWVPPDAVALAARERFGADRVRWDAGARRVSVGSQAAARIRTLRVGVHEDRVRVVLEAAQPVAWSVRPEGDGRIVVGLPGSALSETIARREFSGGPLRAIEPAQGPAGAEVRVAYHGGADQARWFTLSNPFRIVVDLHRAAPRPVGTGVAGRAAPAREGAEVAGQAVPHLAPPVRHPEPRPAAPAGTETVPAVGPAGGGSAPDAPQARASEARPEPPPPPPPAAAAIGAPPGPLLAPARAVGLPAAPRAGARAGQALGEPLTIVIDPGHGGKDTGAIGPRGLREKDIVLDIGLRLRRLLADRLGARVVMTRSDDTFVPLEERTGIARRAQADFFLSIHLNSAHQARATGLETYYLSREPSDGDARASAARENLVMNLEGIGPREQEGLKAILWDMAQTLHIQESSALAEILLEDLGRGLRMETRGVKHGPFVVLMTAGMPSTLVEVGFLSNPQVERRLQEEAYRQQIAAALSLGVEKFAHRYQRRIGMRSPHPGPS